MPGGSSGSPCANVSSQRRRLTGVGMWTFGRFLHNGALSSLEQLFCLEPRPAAGTEPLETGGHAFTCDGLSTEEKQALLAYVRAH